MIRQIDTVLRRAQTELQRLAAEYRRTVMIPLCAKHRLTYLVSMGRTLFSTSEGVDVGSADDARDEGLAFLVPIFEVLDKECVGGNDVFGFYISNITEGDWRLAQRTRARR